LLSYSRSPPSNDLTNGGLVDHQSPRPQTSLRPPFRRKLEPSLSPSARWRVLFPPSCLPDCSLLPCVRTRFFPAHRFSRPVILGLLMVPSSAIRSACTTRHHFPHAAFLPSVHSKRSCLHSILITPCLLSSRSIQLIASSSFRPRVLGAQEAQPGELFDICSRGFAADFGQPRVMTFA